MLYVGGGQTPQHKLYAVVFAIRLMLLHRQLACVAPGMEVIADAAISHDQIGIGTGEDLLPFCYLWERCVHGCSSYRDIMEFNSSRQITEDASSPGYVGYLNGWDIDESALVVCRENLGFTSVGCVMTHNNLYQRTDYCQSVTAATTAAASCTFLIHALLYVLGPLGESSKTKYFIFDNPSNRKNLFEVIELTANLMVDNQPLIDVSKVMKKAKTSKADPKATEEAFHGPFMNSAIAATDVTADQDKGGELTQRDLSYLVVEEFINWVYNNLPPPGANPITNDTETEEIDDMVKHDHCVVRA